MDVPIYTAFTTAAGSLPKREIKTPYFAHSGTTCRQVERDQDAVIQIGFNTIAQNGAKGTAGGIFTVNPLNPSTFNEILRVRFGTVSRNQEVTPRVFNLVALRLK